MVRWIAESEAPCPNADAMNTDKDYAQRMECRRVFYVNKCSNFFLEDLEKRSSLGI